ncbi:uncharacterized protein LOC111314793 [Durio zibethinus]|uniref:Uncharacterized protein LOC111314793 n=1 Tax=Durio zibethinus TaxID=66656 RepID=A0A6P6B4Z9_DURZI|nr:uncharacterized protein LOC111314793 [Durio zibethinus]
MSLPRFMGKNGSKLANDLSSPGSANVPKHVVIVMDGLKEFTTELLEWVLEKIIAPGHIDIVTLLGFMPWLNIPCGATERNCNGVSPTIARCRKNHKSSQQHGLFLTGNSLLKNTLQYGNDNQEGEMDMIKGCPIIDNGKRTPSESPASLVPNPLVIYSEPLKRILEEQELEIDDDD